MGPGVQAAPPAPTMTTPAVQQATVDQALAAASARGQQATFLTGANAAMPPVQRKVLLGG